MKKRRNFIKYNIRIEKNIKIYDKKFLKEFEIASNTIKQKIEETSPSTLNMKRMQSIFELMYNNTFHEKDLINQQEKISANIDENIELINELKENIIKNNNETMNKNINVFKIK